MRKVTSFFVALGIAANAYHPSYAQEESISFDSAHIVGTQQNIIAHRVPVKNLETGQVVLYDVTTEYMVAEDGSIAVKNVSSTKSISQPNSADNFIPGTYSDVNQVCYIVTAAGTTVDGRSTGTVRSESKSVEFSASWISGPVEGHPIISALPEAEQFLDGPNYGTAGQTNLPSFCIGGVIGAIQSGAGITITAYHVPFSNSGSCSRNPKNNPTTPFGRANLTLTPVADTSACNTD